MNYFSINWKKKNKLKININLFVDATRAIVYGYEIKTQKQIEIKINY